MGNHKMVMFKAKGIFKTALKVGIGIKLGLELGDFIKQAKKGSKAAKECCEKYGLNYEDDKTEDS